MPFQSDKQRRYMHANLPDIANRWEAKYGLGGIAHLNDLPEYYIPKNQGGFIPSHEAGIYGLAEGGVTDIGFSKVKPSNDGSRPGYFTSQYGGGGGKSSDTGSSSSGGGDAGHLSHNVSVSHGGTKPDPAPDTGNGNRNIHQDTGTEEEAYVVVGGKKVHQPKWGTTDDPREQIEYKGDEDNEERLEIDLENARRKLKYDDTLTKNERQSLEVGLGLRKAKQKSGFWGMLGKGILTAATMGVLGPGATKLAQAWNTGKNIKTFADTGEIYGFKVKDHLNKINTNLNKQKDSKLDLYKALPDGHPDKIALQVELEIGKKTPDDVPDRDGKTNIKIEEIETVNNVNAEKVALEQKYKEMDQAAYAAWLRQQQMEAQKQSYLKNFRQMYMSAQGGRVPGGYNTGGLSNLFRLKNV